MGHGSGAHAPDEYYVIESTNPNVQGMDGAVTLAGGISVRIGFNLVLADPGCSQRRSDLIILPPS